MIKIEKLIYRIANQLDLKNTQELFISINGEEDKKHVERTQELVTELKDEVIQLQEIFDDPNNVEEISGIYSVMSFTIEEIFKNTDLNLDKLLKNSIGDEKLYKELDKLIKRGK